VALNLHTVVILLKRSVAPRDEHNNYEFAGTFLRTHNNDDDDVDD